MSADHSAPIDLEGFRAAMREAGVEEAVESTLAIYAAEAPDAFERLQAAIEHRDPAAAAAAAHALKSASSNIWATRLVSLLEPVEAAGREGDMGHVIAGFEDMRPTYERVIEYLRDRG